MPASLYQEMGEGLQRPDLSVGGDDLPVPGVDPQDPDVVYGAGRNVVTKCRWPTGQTQSVSPIPVLGDDYRVDRTQPIPREVRRPR